MIEGYRSGSGSGTVPVTNGFGSGSRRQIRIRIRYTAWYHSERWTHPPSSICKLFTDRSSLFLHHVSYKARCIGTSENLSVCKLYITESIERGLFKFEFFASLNFLKFQLKTKKAQAKIVRKLYETVRFGLHASTTARVCCRLMTSGATSLSEQMKQQWRNMTGTGEPYPLFCYSAFPQIFYHSSSRHCTGKSCKNTEREKTWCGTLFPAP